MLRHFALNRKQLLVSEKMGIRHVCGINDEKILNFHIVLKMSTLMIF